MRKQIIGFYKMAFCMILALSTFLATPLHTFAVGTKTETQYIKDIIFIYGENKSQAKENVPQGYTMIETDLNQGAALVFAVDDVYLAYATTTNPDEAITDIKMMNMNGGFVMSDYEDQLANVGQNILDMAAEIKDAVKVFCENYKLKTPGALAAYETLTVFTVDEANDMNLAQYFISGNVSDEFYLKLILNAHTDILAAILSALTMAVQGASGNTWLDRLSKIEDPESIYNDGYWDKASDLYNHFDSFYQEYSSIDHDLFRNGNGEIRLPSDSEGNQGSDVSETANSADVGITGMEALYEVAYATLEQYTFGNGIPISEWLVCDGIYEEMLYPLIEVLTPAEYAMMHLCGPLYMILATSMDHEVYQNYMGEIEPILHEIDSCSVWHGVNSELFHSSIGITDEASRAIAETKASQELNNDGDSDLDDTIKMAGLIASIGAISLGVGLIATTWLSGATASTIGAAAYIGGIFFAAAGVVILCVALVVAIVYVVVWLVNLYDEYHPDYTEIPEYMYDLVTDEYENQQFVLYEVAKSHNGKSVDVNAWEGKEWHAPYISRDAAAGNPIEADIIVKLGDGRVDDGYVPLCAFGEITADNLNRYAYDDEVNGIFISYRQEPQKGAFARGKYLSDLKVFSDKNDDNCKKQIKDKNYILYNLNLTPGSDCYTYIGYKTSNRANLALTDIRVAYNYSAMQYSAGGVNETYAASGSVGGLTIYTTRISMFGSPILSEFLVLNDWNAPIGYEPVNLFSGGPAQNMNAQGGSKIVTDQTFYLYFLPSETFTSGTEYLGGIATGFSYVKKGFSKAGGKVSDAAESLGYQTLMLVNGTSETQGAILYTTTYNPYRAIYNITASANGNEMGYLFVETIKYDQIGYSLAARYIVDFDNNLHYEHANRENDSRLYVSGIHKNGTPMQVSDLYATGNKDFTCEGFIPVSSILTESMTPVNLSGAFNYYHSGTYAAVRDFTMDPLYLFVRDEPYTKGDYVTNLYLVSKEMVLGGLDIDCSDLDKAYVMNSLATQGAHDVIHKNLNLKDNRNATYLGYTKNKSSRTPITDVILYYSGNTNSEPSTKITHNGIIYHLVSDANIFCAENAEKDKCQRVYLYYTSNPAAGEPILDITIDNNPILNGWQTVTTQNGKALHVDLDGFEDDMWFLHIKRYEEDPKYISDITIGWGNKSEAMAMLVAAGCDYFLNKDLNNNCGLASDYVFLGYKRTSDINQAIRDLRTTHDNDVDTFEENGAKYYKIQGNLNSFTNIFADDIYLYYTKDENAGYPIVSLETSEKVNNTTENGIESKTVVNQKDKASDLNAGAAGDYIYLIQNKEIDQSMHSASILGTGSFFIILGFSVASLLGVFFVYFYHKKRKN